MGVYGYSSMYPLAAAGQVSFSSRPAPINGYTMALMPSMQTALPIGRSALIQPTISMAYPQTPIGSSAMPIQLALGSMNSYAATSLNLPQAVGMQPQSAASSYTMPYYGQSTPATSPFMATQSAQGPANLVSSALQTKDQLSGLLNYVNTLTASSGNLAADTSPYGQLPAGPSGSMPYTADPSMADPSMMMDPSMMPQYQAQSYYGNPYGTPYRQSPEFNPSIYNSFPLEQAVNQFRDTQRPEFAMNGELTEDAK